MATGRNRSRSLFPTGAAHDLKHITSSVKHGGVNVIARACVAVDETE